MKFNATAVSCFAMILVMSPLVARAQAPQDFFAELQNARPVQLGKLEGAAGRKNGPAIVQFWASWCVGCKTAMEKTLIAITEKPGHATGSAPVRFITVSMDEDPAAARLYLERAGAMAPKLIDSTLVDTSQKLAEKLQVKAVPTMLFVNADGSIAGRIIGHGSPAEFDRLSKMIAQGH